VTGAAKRILTQKQMRSVRAAVETCYICGKPLPPRGTPGRRKQITGEHVVPRRLLGQPPLGRSDQWAVELDVHRDCEDQTKQGVDDLLALLQTMHTTPVAAWPKVGHLRRLGFTPVLLRAPDDSILIPAFGNAAPILKGAWIWIRGLHMALYREFLPQDCRRFVLPPVPACGQSSGPHMKEVETLSFVIRGAVDLAVKRDKWDGIDAWGGQLSYRCVWKHVPEEYGGPYWICFWGLLFPGVLDWSRTVLPADAERPWHGCYYLLERPDGASYLVSDDFPMPREGEDR
jgi:hypothetical protein